MQMDLNNEPGITAEVLQLGQRVIHTLITQQNPIS